MAALDADKREPRVLSVQSHVAHGYVGNKSAVFPLQLLGFEVDAVNSVQFCCHTGYPVWRGQVLGGDDLWGLATGLDENGLLDGYSHVLTGYIGSATFARKIVDLIKLVKQRSPASTYVCDPVLGDHGKLYVPAELVEIYKTDVVPLATLLTPNQFELELLTGTSIKNEQDAVDAVQALHRQGVKQVCVTSLDYVSDQVVMLLSLGGTQYILALPRLRGRYTGTGDLTTALLLAWLSRHPLEPALALEKVGATLSAVLRRTLRERSERTIAGKVVPPEIALIRSKRAIEDPPRTAPGGEYALVARCRMDSLKGVVFVDVNVDRRAELDGRSPPTWLRRAPRQGALIVGGVGKSKSRAFHCSDGSVASFCERRGLEGKAVLAVVGSSDGAAQAQAAGCLVCALLPGDAAAARDEDEGWLNGHRPLRMTRDLSWFADDASDDDAPPPSETPAWAAACAVCVSSLAGLDRYVNVS